MQGHHDRVIVELSHADAVKVNTSRLNAPVTAFSAALVPNVQPRRDEGSGKPQMRSLIIYI